MLVKTFILIIAFGLSSESEDHGHSLNEHVETLTQLLSDYNKDMVPILDSIPINVTVGIIMLDLVPLEHVDMHFSVEMYFTQQWRDYRLIMKDYEEDTEEIVLGGSIIDKIWIPDSYFPYARIVKHHDVTTPTHYMSVRPNGEIFYSQRLSVVSRCDMNFANFPFDNQVCKFAVESYAYNRRYLRFNWVGESGMSEPENSDMLDFTYDGWTIEKKVATYNFTGEHSFDQLLMKLRFHRNSQWYIIQMYIPCILVVVLSWVGFWIDYRSTPARVSLGITTVLTVVTLSSSIRSSIPTTDYSKSLDYYVILCLFYVFAALIEYAIVGITDKKWSKKFKDERKKLLQSKAMISNYFHRRKRNRMANGKQSQPKNSFVNLAFEANERPENPVDQDHMSSTVSDDHKTTQSSDHNGSALEKFRKIGEIVIKNAKTENNTNQNGSIEVDRQTKNTSQSKTTREVKVNLSTLETQKNDKASQNVLVVPSDRERELLEETYKNAKKKQKTSFLMRIKQKVNDILIKRQRRLENAHVFDRLSKKVFIISFLLFNIFYFAFSLSSGE